MPDSSKPRPSILFVNRVYPPVRGATGRLLKDLARSFAREGWQVTVITSGPKALTERDGAVRVIRVKGAEKPRNAIGYGWVWLKLFWAALSLPKTDVMVSMTDPPFFVIAARIIRAFKGCKHIHWCQDLYPDVFPAIKVKAPQFLMRFLRARVRAAMESCDRVIVIGRCMAKTLTRDGFDPQSITVIPNWADSELVGDHGLEADAQLYTDHIDGYRPHEQQHKQGPRFRVLYAGNLGRAHPVGTIIDAAEILQKTNPDVEFIFVGDGPRYDRINRERARRHIENIRLLPYQPSSRLRELMESGDVHLISMNEKAAGMIVPVKLYAALSVHRPCVFVGPQNTETAKVIEDFNMGRIVAQGDAQALAHEIRQFREASDVWFTAYEGAKSASDVFVPAQSLHAWIDRVHTIVGQDKT